MDDHVFNAEFLGVTRIGPWVIGDDVPEVVVLNLRTRSDRRAQMIKTLGDARIPFRFYTADPHPRGAVEGCRASHMAALEWLAKTYADVKYQGFAVWEDDAEILQPLADVDAPPQDWQIAYLGALCTAIFDWGAPSTRTDGGRWIRGRFFCNHAYIVRRDFVAIIRETLQQQAASIPFDDLLANVLHEKHPCYAWDPAAVIQYADFSDIAGRQKWRDFRWPRVGEQFMIP